MIEMKEKEQDKIKTPSSTQYNSLEEDLDKEIYLFLRGGFAAK